MIWITFAAIAAIIIFAGSRLSSLAEELAETFHISSSAVGLLLVGIVTSLPELSTSLGAVLHVGRPDLAVGNTLGSDLFNLMIIALCDLLFRKKGLLRDAAHHRKTIAYYGVMICTLLIALVLPNQLVIGSYHFNFGSVLIAALYLTLFIRTHRGEQSNAARQEVAVERAKAWKTSLLFAITSAVIIVAGTALANLGDRIAEQTGLEQSFVGSLFLALATSLPELTVSIASMRLGAYDLLVGNIIGSNMFNVFICAISDLAYRGEAFHIPGNLDPGLLALGGCVILMAGTSLLGTCFKRRARFIAWESLALLALYLIGLAALYRS